MNFFLRLGMIAALTLHLGVCAGWAAEGEPEAAGAQPSFDQAYASFLKKAGDAFLQDKALPEPELDGSVPEAEPARGAAQARIGAVRGLLERARAIQTGRAAGATASEFRSSIRRAAEGLRVDAEPALLLYSGRLKIPPAAGTAARAGAKAPARALKEAREKLAKGALAPKHLERTGSAARRTGQALLGSLRRGRDLPAASGRGLPAAGGLTRAELARLNALPAAQSNVSARIKPVPSAGRIGEAAPAGMKAEQFGGLDPKGLAASGWSPDNLSDLSVAIDKGSKAIRKLHEEYPSAVAHAYGGGTMTNIEDSAKWVFSRGKYQLKRGCISHQNETYDAIPKDGSLEVKRVKIGWGLEHHAVVVYPKGADWKESGVVLDGWKYQSSDPNKITFRRDRWQRIFWPLAFKGARLEE
ncbi:MAG: hypothetical protein ABII00_09300 [Elusimicrobiota bacterium]